ncbi:unnamed protein product, partial [Mesorhabditis belari]|uniref:G-protein coupled receptors family 1 profile domain-containing protein n=1 Tax=Mesorhabditis belari TaxID=2138241 RepID=A0AAF3FDB8_9BILA
MGDLVGMDGDDYYDQFLPMHSNQCIEVGMLMRVNGDLTSRAEVRVLYTLIYFVIFVIGVIGNGLLISSTVMRRRITVANIFLVNLAISDLLLCITAIPITPTLAFFKKWMFGEFMCKFLPAWQAVSVLISTYSLCFIAVDRYRSIVTPLKEPWTIRNAQAIMLMTWLMASFLAMPLYYTQTLIKINLPDGSSLCDDFCGEYDWPNNDMYKLSYGFMLLMLTFVVPALIMTFCYMKILQKVRKDWIVAEGSMLTAAQQVQTAARKRRVMYVLILMVVVFMLCWLPLTVVNLLRDLVFLRPEHQMYFILLNAHALAMTSILWNPILYFWMSKRHRRALKDDMFWLTNAKRQPASALSRFAPSPSVSVVYKRALERHLINNTFRRGTLADPTCMSRERALEEMHANCFLLVPLMPLCQNVRRNSHLALDGHHHRIIRHSSSGSGHNRRRQSTITETTRASITIKET